LLWSRPQPQEPKLSHVEHSGDTFLTRIHIRTWGRRCWVCSNNSVSACDTFRTWADVSKADRHALFWIDNLVYAPQWTASLYRK